MNAPTTLRLHHSIFSASSQKVRLALVEKGLVHESVAVIDAAAGANHARAPEKLFAERRLARVNVRRNPERQIHGCSSVCAFAASSSSRMRSNTASTTFCWWRVNLRPSR